MMTMVKRACQKPCLFRDVIPGFIKKFALATWSKFIMVSFNVFASFGLAWYIRPKAGLVKVTVHLCKSGCG